MSSCCRDFSERRETPQKEELSPWAQTCNGFKGDAQPGTTVAACRCKHPTESSSEQLTASSQGCLQ